MRRLFLKEEKGQALVELALILPVLLLLVFGIVEFGRVYGAYLTVNHAAREGARAAAVGFNDIDTEEVVLNASSSLAAENVKITIAPSTRVRGEEVRVRVSYPVELYAPFIKQILPNPLTVEGEVVMRVE